MKPHLTPVLFITLLAVLLVARFSDNQMQLQTGDIAFIAWKTNGRDGFALLTFKDIKPKTQIFFTDAEWNGTHFGPGENTLTWLSDKGLILAGSVIVFEDINYHPRVSRGSLKGEMKLNPDREAIFAYVGSGPKMPSHFLAAVANSPEGFGTLVHTGLKERNALIIYPEGTYFAEYQGPRRHLEKEHALEAISMAGNYLFNPAKEYPKDESQKLSAVFNRRHFSFISSVK
ncbi:MAG TPA: hypothetical protein VKN36_00540 [Eudoraea sp.]|nr:hypothetical protein [Eudoraea sp.]